MAPESLDQCLGWKGCQCVPDPIEAYIYIYLHIDLNKYNICKKKYIYIQTLSIYILHMYLKISQGIYACMMFKLLMHEICNTSTCIYDIVYAYICCLNDLSLSWQESP